MGSPWDHFGITSGGLWDHFGVREPLLGFGGTQKTFWRTPGSDTEYGDEPFVALLETSRFGSLGGGKESVYRLYSMTKVNYFAII